MVVNDTGDLIRASREIAEILRPSVSGSGDFAGPHESEEESLGSVPIEFQQMSPVDLKQVGADGMCSMLPDSGIAEGDILIFDEIRFRVVDVKPVNCFGAVSHLKVRLEREYKS